MERGLAADRAVGRKSQPPGRLPGLHPRPLEDPAEASDRRSLACLLFAGTVTGAARRRRERRRRPTLCRRIIQRFQSVTADSATLFGGSRGRRTAPRRTPSTLGCTGRPGLFGGGRARPLISGPLYFSIHRERENYLGRVDADVEAADGGIRATGHTVPPGERGSLGAASVSNGAIAPNPYERTRNEQSKRARHGEQVLM